MPAKKNRKKQIQRDKYFMGIARAVESDACLGSNIGAVIVVEDRVVSTGYNGTPAGVKNCTEGGCLRCKDRTLFMLGQASQMSDPAHVPGAALDRCICVHAEQNAFLAAARYGIRLDGSTLYTTLNPCFGCLKEAIQAGIVRIVYDAEYVTNYSAPVKAQYADLVQHLRQSGEYAFEPLEGHRPERVNMGPPDPYEEVAQTTSSPAKAHATSGRRVARARPTSGTRPTRR